MKETALQQLISKYELQLREIRKKIRKVDAVYRDVWRARESQLCSAIHLAKNLLSTERQQIEDAYSEGYATAMYEAETIKNTTSEQYFTETYKTI